MQVHNTKYVTQKYPANYLFSCLCVHEQKKFFHTFVAIIKIYETTVPEKQHVVLLGKMGYSEQQINKASRISQSTVYDIIVSDSDRKNNSKQTKYWTP